MNTGAGVFKPLPVFGENGLFQTVLRFYSENPDTFQRNHFLWALIFGRDYDNINR